MLNDNSELYPTPISYFHVMFAIWCRAVFGHSTSLMSVPLPKEGFCPAREEHQHPLAVTVRCPGGSMRAAPLLTLRGASAVAHWNRSFRFIRCHFDDHPND
jgi:hypothetical protein